MKLSIKLIAIAFAIAFASCKHKDKKDDESATEYAEANKEEANDIIEYNNVLVKYSDNNNSYLKSMERSLNIIDKGLENPTDPFAFASATTPFMTPTFNLSKIKPETPPSALNSDDQKFFKENVIGLKETIEKIQKTYESLDSYIRAEDFKDDKSVKGKQLVDSIYNMSKKYYTYDDKILIRLEAIGDDAERIILKSHPLKDYIFALKDDRKAVQEFNKLITGSADDYKAAESKIKTAYDKLVEQNKKHTEMDAPDAKDYPGKDSAFKRFNDSFNEYLIEARKIMRNASASGKISKDDEENLFRNQDYMRSAYNTFVN
ncbi:DUF3829 domain-containing protein [Pedobacter rhodius]|uniref:DUF3829 domain-containing protein n=1 Tax=Pedobacter rhodius TaxID=3004098 RepID=A0ABT4KXB8_9SPHI|nr:DUF3829 domain-containing protein [Pedobacter sp. SJ11]MCZ4223578.1 DUF3829 domain-containing protein [Pedobacter sp. SJ11]